MTEYMTETKFRNAVRKVLGKAVNSKSERWSARGINVINAEGHWNKDATHFYVKASARALSQSQVDIERQLVLAGFEMVKWDSSEWETEDERFHIAWRKAV